MNIPQSQYLHSQNFNSNFLEFVWRFPQFNQNYQVIFITFLDGFVYQEEGIVDESGDYVDGHVEMSAPVSNGHISMNELESLKKEAIEFLS